jgi:hypothetical protein
MTFVFSDGVNLVNSLVTTGNAYEMDGWAHFALCVELDSTSRDSQAYLFVNGIQNARSVLGGVVIDY